MYGIILAGGSGSRLWPLSRELYPKQLIKLNGKKSLLEDTFLRLKEVIEPKNIISITNVKHASDVKMQLSDITSNPGILVEPTQKNTAPAIAAAVKYIADTSQKDPVILVVPSDHLIKDISAFKETVKKGEALAKEGYIVTFGVTPSSPHTGYGYVGTVSPAVHKLEGGLKVREFTEKPDMQTARLYLNKGGYFWNSGIFMFKASTLFKALSAYAPGIATVVKQMNFKINPNISFDLFNKMPSISIDYAVMENADNIALVPLESDWNDLGCWQAIYATNPKDAYNNVTIGNVFNEGSENCLIYSSSRVVAAIGLDDIALIETPDAVLACKKDKAQDVKKVYDKLKENKNNSYLIHKTVYRPWGYYTVLEEGEGYLLKIITVNPGARLSLQLHNYRSEHWVVVKGDAKVVLGEKSFTLSTGQSIDIPLKEKHSLQNPYDTELQIIEVQKGDHISEDDIERFEDLYGRV